MKKDSEAGPDYSGMTVKDLKIELKKKGLPVSGVKSKLIERLKTSASLFVYSIEDSKYWNLQLRISRKN
mgnify:CR=1 FL=1